MLSLPLFYFPTSIVCVDDEALMLKTLTMMLGAKYKVKVIDNPKDGISYLQNYVSPLSQRSLLQGFVEHEYYDTMNHIPVDLDINNIFYLSKQANRYEEISIAIIDYTMPDMNGIEMCRHLSHPWLKKILLTGQADYSKAIEAFNEGIINCFVSKANPTLAEELKAYVNTLAQDYFIELTSSLRAHLEADGKLPFSDPVFIRVFNQWINEHQIKEYYLIDKNGSFLLINDKEETSYFVVHTDKSLDSLITSFEDYVGVDKFIQRIKTRQKIPFFGSGISADEVAPSEWEQYLYAPKILEGRERYYWLVV